LVPPSVVPFEYFSLEMINTLYQSGATEDASAMAEEAYRSFEQMLAYLMSMPDHFLVSGDVNEEIQRNFFYLQKLERTCRASGDAELSARITKTIEEYLRKYPGQ